MEHHDHHHSGHDMIHDMHDMHDDHGGHEGGGMDGGHGGHEGHGDASCPMIMTFHWRLCETILWESWKAIDESEFFGSMFGVFMMALAYEAIKVLREVLYMRASSAERDAAIRVAAKAAASNHNGLRSSGTHAANGQCCTPPRVERSVARRILDKYHIIQTFLHFVQVIVSYLLMLIVMTFNGYLCVAVALGAAVGYFAFGWVKQKSIEVGDHCN
uniref:Copper transport protein n=1 Tax=Tabanus bromius TaxID=304241 RepID=A0A0K8TQR2_TABBR